MIKQKSNLQEHFVVPDTQCKEGVLLNHLEAAGNYIVDKQPNTIIHLGDHWDMPSLSSYEKRGSKYFEGKQYLKDIEAGLQGMETLLKPINEYNAMRKKNKKKAYTPRMIFIPGNHEDRVTRATKDDPRLEGVITRDHFKLQEFGWEVPTYLQPVDVDGVKYAHYFYNPMTGKPYGGRAYTRLQNIGFSFTMGHVQGKDIAEKHLADGRTLRGLVVGSFYQHDEEYKGPQANSHWRGCIYKHEVQAGNYCLMELSMDYLLREWL